MPSVRQNQVAELIKRNFSIVLQMEGSYVYGNSALVTVTNVKISPDFSLAKIYLSIFNTEHKQEVILQMEDEKTRLHQALVRRVRRHMRKIPDIDFYLDDTLDEMYRLRALFDRLHEEDQMGSQEDDEDNGTQ